MYYQAVGLSGRDVNGYPQLSKLEFVLEYAEFEVEDKAVFYEYIQAIHNWNIRITTESIEAKRG